MPKGSRKKFKNIAMLTVRNKTKQEVTNVIFPNGLTIGVDDGKFLNGAKIFGNVVVSGTLSAGEIMKNGAPLSTTTSTSAAPFLFLDLNSNVFAFDNSADTSATPPTIVLSAQQVSQSSTFKGPIFSLSGSTGTNLTGALGSDVLTETGTGTATRTVVITYSNASMRSVFPLTASVSYAGLTSTKLISMVQGGTDGDDGDDGADGGTGPTGAQGLDGNMPTTLTLDLNAGVFAFTGSDDVTATPPDIVMTAKQVSQSSTLVTGDFSLTGYDGTNLSSHVGSFDVSATSTGTSTATKVITYNNSAMRSKFPLTASISNDGLTSTKIISSVQGADPTVTAAFTTSVISVETDADGAALDDAGDLSDSDISEQAFTKLDVDAGSQNITFAGHNESGNPAVNTYKIVSDDITATTDNGTSLTEANSASEGDGVGGTYNITFANSGTRLTLTVSTDSGDAKLKVASLAKDEDGSSTAFTSIVVNVPIKVTTSGGTKTITRSFTVAKNKKGTTGSAGSSAVTDFIQIVGSATLVEDPGATNYVYTDFNITDLDTQNILVGSSYFTHTDVVVTADNTIDSADGGDATKDSLKLATNGSKVLIEASVTLNFGTAPATYSPDGAASPNPRPPGGIAGELCIVHATDVVESSHSSTARDYGTEIGSANWSVSYDQGGESYPSSGQYLTVNTAIAHTLGATDTYFWLRLSNYVRINYFSDAARGYVNVPRFLISEAKMTVTRLS